MKTFEQFMLIAEDKMGERLGNMSDADFDQFLKGRTPGESQTYKEKRVKFKKTKVSSKDAGFGSQSKTQTPPKGTQTQTPPRGTQTQTPPKGTQTPPPSSNPPKSSAPPKAGPLSQAPKPSAVKPNAIKNLKGLKGGSVLSGVIDTAVEKSSGSGWARSLAKGATTALGTVAGGVLGSAAGPVGTFAGGTAGGMAASKAFDTVAGANAVGRKAIATANRKSQSGGGLVGTGGKTTFDTKKNTITSGGKTAQLGKTSVVTDPKTGKQGVGYLAYKGGKAVYKKPDTKSLAQTSSNPLERVGRSLFGGAYKANDAKLAAAKLKTAAASDASRNKQLGVKLKPGG
jgi:hypothetical protein